MIFVYNQHKAKKSIKALSFLMLGGTKQEGLRKRFERSTSVTADNQLCADTHAFFNGWQNNFKNLVTHTTNISQPFHAQWRDKR